MTPHKKQDLEVAKVLLDKAYEYQMSLTQFQKE